MYMGVNNGLTLEQLVSIGDSPFNMTVGALRLSKISNAVAQLHNETANKMWLYVKGRSEIVGITNAIHIPTWVDEWMIHLAVKGQDLWETHMENKNTGIAKPYRYPCVFILPLIHSHQAKW